MVYEQIAAELAAFVLSPIVATGILYKARHSIKDFFKDPIKYESSRVLELSATGSKQLLNNTTGIPHLMADLQDMVQAGNQASIRSLARLQAWETYELTKQAVIADLKHQVRNSRW